MKSIHANYDGDVSELPRNMLSTRLGRFVDRVSYVTVAAIATASILASAIYFRLAANTSNGLTSSSLLKNDFWEALYFSIVTFTTVGYGDLVPIGWGRTVVAIEVLTGLMLTALLIGKIASERQAALLLLIYTSEQQRRIASFAQEVREFSDELSRYRAVGKERATAFALLTRSLRAYLVFQSHQGRLADFGNESALRNLYRSLRELLESIHHAFETQPLNPSVEEQLLKVVGRVSRLAKIMTTFHSGDKSSNTPLIHIAEWTKRIESWEATAVTWRRLDQVASVIPRKPWPKHFHKRAAERLGISQNLFRRCMDRLILSGRV
jgi:hypothetical protein